MAQPYVGEIRMFAGNFAPAGWRLCNGALLPIVQNETLFSLIGTIYGGDGISTFALPDLRGRVPVHQGSGFSIGQAAGSEMVTLTVGQLPSHTHVPAGSSSPGSTDSPAGAAAWATAATPLYSASTPNAQLNAGAIAPTGQGQAHNNMMPFLGMNFIISLFGIYPSPV